MPRVNPGFDEGAAKRVLRSPKIPSRTPTTVTHHRLQHVMCDSFLYGVRRYGVWPTSFAPSHRENLE